MDCESSIVNRRSTESKKDALAPAFCGCMEARYESSEEIVCQNAPLQQQEVDQGALLRSAFNMTPRLLAAASMDHVLASTSIDCVKAIYMCDLFAHRCQYVISADTGLRCARENASAHIS